MAVAASRRINVRLSAVPVSSMAASSSHMVRLYRSRSRHCAAAAAWFACLTPGASAQQPAESVEATPVVASAADLPSEPAVLPGPADDDPAELRRPAATHPWLRFSPGAWRQTVIASQTLGAQGEVASEGVTTQEQTLEAVAGDRYVIRSRASVTALGRVIEGEWVESSFSPLLDGPGNLVAQKRLPDEAVVIDGRQVDCEVWLLEYDDGGRRRSDRLWFSPAVYPHVLMRQRLTLADDAEAAPDRIETTEVIAGSMPYRVGETVQLCACLRTTIEGPKGRTVQIDVVSPAVPGGQVAAWSTDWDSDDRRVQTVVAETIDYGAEPADPPLRPGQERRQQRRERRESRSP